MDTKGSGINGLHLKIVSPERILVEGIVSTINLPGTMGSFSVYPKHAPLISSLKRGTITYEQQGEVKTLEIMNGFVEINQDTVSICIE